MKNVKTKLASILLASFVAIFALGNFACSEKKPATTASKTGTKTLTFEKSSGTNNQIIAGHNKLDFSFNEEILLESTQNIKIKKDNADFTEFKTQLKAGDNKTIEIVFDDVKEPMALSTYEIILPETLSNIQNLGLTNPQTIKFVTIAEDSIYYALATEGFTPTADSVFENAKNLSALLVELKKNNIYNYTIFLSKGTHYADSEKKDPAKSFELFGDFKIFGGYDNDLATPRDFIATILEGNLGTTNTKTMLKMEGFTKQNTLDGFVIQNVKNDVTNKKGIVDIGSKPTGEDAKFTNLTFKNNENINNGGILYLNEDQPINIIDCTFEGNKSKDGTQQNYNRGGVIFTDAEILVENSIFEKNSAADGGAIFTQNDNLTVKNSKFIENKADRGGAIAASNSSNFTVKDSIFEKNTVSAVAGAMAIGSAKKVEIINSKFDSNSAVGNARSSALDIYADEALIDKSTFANHPNSLLGGVVVFGGGKIKVTNSTFKNNTTSLYSSLTIGNAKASIYNSLFYDNKAETHSFAMSDDSGVIQNYSTDDLVEAKNRLGGALSLIGTDAEVVNSVFYNNKTNQEETDFCSGGAINAGTAGDETSEKALTVANSIFLNNTTKDDNAKLGLDICLLFINTGDKNVVLANKHNINFEIFNSILNSDIIEMRKIGAATKYTPENFPMVPTYYNKINDPLATAANIFTNVAKFDFSIKATSIAKDAGDDGRYDDAIAGDKDFAGNPRKVNKIDIGAYEVQ